MSFLRFACNSAWVWRRRLAASVLVLSLWAFFTGGIQSALARPLLQATETPTPTVSATFTATSTATITATETSKYTPTITLTPTITSTPLATRLIVINEIGWAGTLADENAEWIELYNSSPLDIDLTGWSLRYVDDSSSLFLHGTIKSGEYFLLAREGHNPFINATSTPSRTPAVTVTAGVTPTALFEPPLNIDQYFSVPLANTGVSLELVAPDGVVIDRANSTRVNGAVSPWPAGDATTRCSMERLVERVEGGPLISMPDSPSSWVTANSQGSNGRDTKMNRICGSPRNRNWGYMVTLTPSPSITPTRTLTPTRTPAGQASAVPTATRTPNRTLPSSIVINEFLTQPRTDWNGDGKVDSGDEYIELINLSTQPVSISGWRLDDQDGDSAPFSIGNITMQPKVRLAFFTSQTGILLSNGGDSVRLYKSSGQISDAYTYGVVQVADTSWCRLPDGGNTWVFGCAPTVAQPNRMGGGRAESSICLSKILPFGIFLAECDPILGLSMWDSNLWDALSLKFPLFFNVETNTYILE